MSATRYRFEDSEEAQEYYLENGLTDGLTHCCAHRGPGESDAGLFRP